MKPSQTSTRATGGSGAQSVKPGTEVIDPNDAAGGGDADQEAAAAAAADDDDAIAAFFQEVKQETGSAHVIRKVSGFQDLDVIRLGPDFIDEKYNECTPVALWLKSQPAVNFDSFLERADEEIITITPIKPQTFSALFAFYRDRSPALNWDPNLTDLEEDCFYQELVRWPSKKLTHSLPTETKKEPVPKKRVKVFLPNGDYIIKTRITIDLHETPTVMLFEIKGVMVLESDSNFASVKVKNERYKEMVKDHQVSDTYANDYAQCFDNYSLSKYTDNKINWCQDRGTQVHTYTIVDEYVEVAEEDAKRKIIEQDEAAARALAEKARLEIPVHGWKDSDSEDSDEERVNDVLDFRTDISKYKEDDEDNHRTLILDEASDDDIAMTEEDEDEFEIRQSLDLYYQNRTMIESKKPPRNYPDISFSLIAMERIICMESQQMRQADMRGLIEPEPVKSSYGLSHIEEDDTTKAEGELDEDAMVSLLIEQHRMQEQLENQGALDEGVPTIIIPDDDEVSPGATKDADDDDDLLQEANAAEEAERKKQEQAKAEADAAAAAAAAAALAAQQAMEKDPEEKDEFDLAVEELRVAAKEGDNIADLFASEQLSHSLAKGVTTTADQSEITAPPTADIPSSVEQESGSRHEEVSGAELPTSAEAKPVSSEVKTIVAPQKGATAPPSTAPSQMLPIAGTGKVSDLKCNWNEMDEKFDEERRLQEDMEAGIPDVVDGLPLDLPQYNAEEGLSDDEADLWMKAKKQIDLTTGMAEMAEEGGSAPSTAEPVATAVQQKVVEKKPSKEEEAEKPPPEEDEFDDISSDETHHENSELSDHWELSEDASTDSEASEKRKSLRKTWDQATSKSYMTEWGGGKDPIDNDTIAPMQAGPHLRQYWTFKCRESAGLEVTDITLHPLNKNIIAASYGSVRFGDHEKEGVICIWNAKNNQSPERIYKLRAPGTSLAFSELTPFVLAVGMLDGNVVLFDVREDDAVILGATVDQKNYYGHIGPIWQVYFVIQPDPSNDKVLEESMLTLGDDGLLKRWTITKGLESTVVMKVGRSTMQVPGRREKRSESLITTLSIAYTVCFFPNNSDLFLLGTEEGFIHKCSTAYKESYVNTYVGHTGPVYRVAFSSFDESVFFSCGGDWTVKMWTLEHPVPLLSLQTGHRTIFDVTCSVFASTIFICTTEYLVEVWDLSVNTLEPVVQYKPPFAVGQRKVTFNKLLNSVIIGDDEGNLTIYGLRNFPKTAPSKEAQKELLLESLLPGYKRRKEAEKLANQGKGAHSHGHGH